MTLRHPIVRKTLLLRSIGSMLLSHRLLASRLRYCVPGDHSTSSTRRTTLFTAAALAKPSTGQRKLFTSKYAARLHVTRPLAASQVSYRGNGIATYFGRSNSTSTGHINIQRLPTTHSSAVRLTCCSLFIKFSLLPTQCKDSRANCLPLQSQRFNAALMKPNSCNTIDSYG